MTSSVSCQGNPASPAGSDGEDRVCPLKATCALFVILHGRGEGKKNPGFILAYEDNYSYFFCGVYAVLRRRTRDGGGENVKTTPSIGGQRVHAIHGSVAFVESNWWKRSACMMGIISRRTD